MSSEIIEKRSIFEKHILNEDGTVTCQINAEPIHYLKNDNTYEEIDNNFYVNTISIPAYYKFQTLNNIFRVGLAEDLSIDKSFKFALRYDGLGEIYTTIKGYALYDSSLDEYTIFESPSSSIGTIDGNKATYLNVFDGIDYEINSNYDGIKEFIYINNRLNIPDPISLGYNPATTYVVIINKIETDILELNYTGEELELLDSGIKKVYSPKEWAKSYRNINLTIFNHYDEITNEYFFGVPYSEMMVASLPITIDPTFISSSYSGVENYNLTYWENSSDGTTWGYGGSNPVHPAYMYVGYTAFVDSNYDPDTKVTTYWNNYINYRSAIKYNILNIPVNNIVSAEFKLTKNSSSNANTATLAFTRITQPLLKSTTSEVISGISTIASSPIIQTVSNFGTLSSYSIDIKDVVIDWINGVYPNYGIGIYAPSLEDRTPPFPIPYSSNAFFYALGSASYPYIEIKYTQADAPTNFIGTPMSNGKINWSWQDNSNIETEFRLRDENDNLVNTISANSTIFLEDLLDFDTNYTRKISAYANNVETGYEIKTVKTLPLVTTTIATSTLVSTIPNNKRKIVKDKSGNTYCAYYSYSGGISEIYVKKILPDGTISTESAFSSYVSSTSLSVANINLAIDSNDYLHLVYQLGSNTTAYWMYNKTSWVSKPSFSNSTLSSIVIDSNNVLHIVYKDTTATNAINYKNSSDNFTSSKTITALTSNYTISNIELTLDTNNNPHVVWQQKYSSNNIEIYYSNKTSTNFISSKPISNASGLLTDCFEPTIAIDSANNIHVLFRIKNTTYASPFYHLGYVRSINLGTNFSSLTQIEKLNTGTVGHDQHSPTLTIDSNKNVYFIFGGYSPSSPNISQLKYIRLTYTDGITWTMSRTVIMKTFTSLNVITPISRYSTFNNNFGANISFMYHDGTGVGNLYYYEIAPDKPLVPTIFNSTSTTLNSITWNWSDVSDEKGYRIMDGATIKQTLGIGVTSWTELGLNPGQSYTRQLVAYNDAGDSPSIAATVSTQNLNPPNLIATTLSSSRIEWSITPYYEAIEYYLYDLNDFKFGRILKEGGNWNVYLDSNPFVIAQSYPTSGNPKFMLSSLLENTSYALKVSSVFNSQVSTLKSVRASVTNTVPSFSTFTGTKIDINNLDWLITK